MNNRDYTRKNIASPKMKKSSNGNEDMSVSRRSDWKKFKGPIRRPTNTGASMKMPGGYLGLAQKKNTDTSEEEKGVEFEIPNPNNLPIMHIKILVAGIEGSNQNKIVDLYGAVDSELTNDEFKIKEMAVEDQYYLMLIEFWIP